MPDITVKELHDKFTMASNESLAAFIDSMIEAALPYERRRDMNSEISYGYFMSLANIATCELLDREQRPRYAPPECYLVV